ncbi:unnamed protein product [Discula destructiva]
MDDGDMNMFDVLQDACDGSFTPRDDNVQTALFAQEAAAAINEAALEEDYAGDAVDGEWDSPARSSEKKSADRKLRTVFVNLPKTTLIHPRSVFEGFVPPAPLATEAHAIQSLLEADPTQEDGDFIEFQLEDFSCYIYKDNKTVPFEMRSLHMHACQTGQQYFYFDGILRAGNTRYYVHKVTFDEIPLGNYGKEVSTVDDQLWICSDLNQKSNKTAGKPIYYKLKKPSLEYARFHNPFLWVADLAKHVVDFCQDLVGNGLNVSLCHFKEAFCRWLKKTHQKDPAFLKWYKQRGSGDFRQSIVANCGFIRKEVFSMLKHTDFKRLHIFQELGNTLYKRIGVDPAKMKPRDGVPHTIVTPYIYRCFSHMGLDQLLKAVEPSISTFERIKLSWPRSPAEDLRFTRNPVRPVSRERKAMVNLIEVGDLISTPPDNKESGTRWRTERSDKNWFGLVQKVHVMKSKRKFDVIWLYQPDDTPCCAAKYPWANELFLSNHCTCFQDVKAKVAEDEVLDVHSVEWFGTPKATTEFFVRQTYSTTRELRRFIALEGSHLRCNHDAEPSPEYDTGDTVLVLACGLKILEPFELLEYMDGNSAVRLRRLKRRREFDSNCAPNELVYTDQETIMPATAIATRCIIRLYTPGQSVPAPYNRKGAGNAFFITHRLLVDGSLEPLGPSSQPLLRQGFDPTKREEKLRSLDLFCGCGNLGRGVEDGGAVSARWANDIKSVAIHTYMANADDPDRCHPFLGSIDDLVLRGLQGQFSDSVPRPGDVDVVLGGSPCPGFSLLTIQKETLAQHKNRSLVASFAACIDYWRPRWGILENVTTIVKRDMKHRDTEDFFSQLICALVGMGYQAQIILGDAWSYGDPQCRVRAFLYFAAPGVQLPKSPYPSHSSPDFITANRLGKMTNGEAYVERRLDRPTAFRFVSARDGTADLPDIYDAKPDTCIPHPDHRLSISLPSGNLNGVLGGKGKNKRAQFFNIPIAPYGVNFSKALYIPRTPEGHPDMFPHERDAFPDETSHRASRISKGWGRAHPNELFATVTTVCSPTDARVGGRYTHWDQPRSISIMEIRRAQGVPDGEVLLGGPREQWALVGNAVARGISMALGLSLREAWLGTLYEEGSQSQGQGQGQRLLELTGSVAEREAENDLKIPWMASYVRYDANDDVVLLSTITTSDNSRSTSVIPAASEAELGSPRFYSTTPTTSDDVHTDQLLSTAMNGKRPLSKVLAERQLDSSSNTPAFKRPRLADEVSWWSGPQEQPVRAERSSAAAIPVYGEVEGEDELVLLGESGLPMDSAEDTRQAVTPSHPGDEEKDDDDGLVLVGSSGPLCDESDDEDLVLLACSGPMAEIASGVPDGSGIHGTRPLAFSPADESVPLRSASGLTVVRMSSVDLLDEF